jgi:CubicO group peptidase (beta-lactamase class C family)
MVPALLLLQTLVAASDPETAGMSRAALKNATGVLEAGIRSGEIHSASILVARRGKIVLHNGFGRMSAASGAAAVQPDSVYLLASITKPVTACALMLLVERGSVALNDPVKRYLPEFQGGDKDKVLVRDLVSHTSGLPDMLPENTELRRAHAPLSTFVERTYKTPLLYAPGTDFRYQSMGILLAGAIVEKITGMRLREFVKRDIFDPLGMRNSAIGVGSVPVADTVQAWVSPNANAADNERFGANSAYWRDMGHPWGGMHSTVTDLARLLTAVLNGGIYGGKRLFSPATTTAMITDQNQKLGAPWGLGWALGRSKAWNFFGDLVSAKTFGHAGATGTVAWADPETGVVCVILTDHLVQDGSLLRRVSNAVAAAVRD